MQILTRWFAPALLAAGLGFGAMAPAQAQDSLSRVLVDVADVVFNGGTPYYRYGNYSPDDRLVVGRDAYGRPIYYRQVPYAYRNGDRDYGDRDYDHDGDGRYYPRRDHRGAPPYGNAYGYYRNGPGSDRRHGWSGAQHRRDRDDRDHNWRDRGGRDDDDD